MGISYFQHTMSDKTVVRNLTRGAYDLQKLRIETGNRLVANFRTRLGIKPGEEADSDEQAILDQVKASYKRITDGVAEVTARRKYDYDDIITDYVSLRLVDRYMNLLREEARTFRDIERALEGVPIYQQFLLNVKGVGPAMAGCIVSELDPHKAPYPSSFWKYCGLDVVDGEGKSREHLVEQEYTVKKTGEVKTKMGLGYNPFIKTKLMGVLSSSFLRSGSEYREMFYDPYRHRIDTDPNHEDKSDGHRHQMALRYMIKQFLVDLHMKWRYIEGLPVSQPYHVKKQGGNSHQREERLGITDPKRFED